MYSYKCGSCGAYLDPGERCDCKEKAPAGGAAEARADARTMIVEISIAQRKNSVKYRRAAWR